LTIDLSLESVSKISSETKVESATSTLSSVLPSGFRVDNRVLRILWDRHVSTLMSSVAITDSLILHPVILPTEVADNSGNAVDTRDSIFLLWNHKGKRGISPVIGHLVDVDGLRLNVGQVYPLESMASDRLAKRWLEGESIAKDLVKEYERNLHQIRERVEMPNETYEHIACLYRIATHFHSAFQTFPYLDIIGPPMSGKTRLNYTVGAGTLHPILTPDLSSSAFFHWRQALGCTIVIDEKRLTAREEGTLRDLMNSGYKRGGRVLRMVRNVVSDFAPRMYSVYGPIQYSGARILPFMTSTRTITIPMKKTLDPKYSDFEDLLPESTEATELRENLYLARLELGFKALEIYESLRSSQFGMSNRQWELAHSLVAVAMLIDKKLIRYVVDFFKQSSEEASDITDRDEGKVLSVLHSAVASPDWSDHSILVKDISQSIAQTFDEDIRDWRSKRVAEALRLLNFRTFLSQGLTKVLIKRAHVLDLYSRYMGTNLSNSARDNSTLSTSSTEIGPMDFFVGRGVEEVEENQAVKIEKAAIDLGLEGRKASA